MSESNDRVPAIEACLSVTQGTTVQLNSKLRDLFTSKESQQISSEELHNLRDSIANLPRLDLVYGGATKIKEYVFEAPKLPEIRGASALLDWVNDKELLYLWRSQLGPLFCTLPDITEEQAKELAKQCIIYVGGGNILALAPQGYGRTLASAIEHTFTDWTLTAHSVAVWIEVSLLELRYGRLCPKIASADFYWVEDFLADCQDSRKRELLYQYYYPNGTTPDAPTDRERFFQRKTFGELVTLLATMFNRRREEQASHGAERHVPFYPLMPWAAKCDSSGIRPAVYRGTVGDAERQMSEASARKRFVGQVFKGEKQATDWFPDLFDWNTPARLRQEGKGWERWIDEEDRDSWEQKWTTWLGQPEQANTPYRRELNRLQAEVYTAQAPQSQAKVYPAQDVHQIGALSDRYIGMIYADGNNVAQYMAVCQTPQQYIERSQKLSEATKTAVFTALAQHLRPTKVSTRKGHERFIHPFEILTIGGDDLLLLVPGKYALDIALTIAQTFEQYMPDPQAGSRRLNDRYNSHQQRLPYNFANTTPEVGISAGVLIAHENMPIFFLRTLVEELLKSAKKLARERFNQHGDRGGAVDFMVLKAITMVTDDIPTFRAAALNDDPQPTEQTKRLTARPYTWHELAGLISTVRVLKQARMPRSQLYRLRDSLETAPWSSVITSSLEYLTTRTRLNQQQSTALFTTIETQWQTPGINQPSGAPPWLRRKDKGWETIWPDLVEIYDLIEEEDRHAPHTD